MDIFEILLLFKKRDNLCKINLCWKNDRKMRENYHTPIKVS